MTIQLVYTCNTGADVTDVQPIHNPQSSVSQYS